MKPRALPLVVCIALLPAWPSVTRKARAQEEVVVPGGAQQLFDEGRKLYADAKYEAALAKFEASQRLAPSVGALLNIADCDAHLGRTASAWARFLEAATLAHRTSDPKREAYAKQRADVLEPKLSRLTVTTASPPAGMSVVLDGVPLNGAVLDVPLPIDPGHHVIEAKAPGRATYRSEVDVPPDGARVKVAIPTLSVLPTTPIESKPMASPSTWSTQKTAAVVVSAVALTGLAVGSVFGLSARSKWIDAQGKCTPLGCPDDAITEQHDAKRAALVSTLSFSIAAAAALTGVTLWLTAPSSTDGGTSMQLAPTLGGVTLHGRF